MKKMLAFIKRLYPQTLMSRHFRLWLAATTATFVVFDILWSAAADNFNGFTFNVWIFATLTLGWGAAMPAAFCRRQWVMAAAVLALDIFLYANLLFFREFHSAIPADNYRLVFQAAGEGGSVVQLMKWTDIALLLPLVAAVTVPCRRKKSESASGPDAGGKRRRALSYFLILAILWLLGSLSFIKAGGFKKYMNKEYSGFFGGFVPVLPAVYSPLAIIVYDLMADEGISDGDRAMVENWLDRHSSLAPAGDIPARELPDHVVFISCESLESWPIGTTVEGQEITPFLNRLTADTATFYAPHVLSQVGIGRSSDSRLEYLAGLLPIRHGGVYSSRYCRGNTRYYTIPKAVGENGMRSCLATNDTRTLWNLEQMATAFGFDSIIDKENYHHLSGKDIDDLEFMRQTLKKIDNGEIWHDGERNFTFVLTRDGHSPFKSRPRDLLKLRGKYPSPLADYMQSTAFVDSALREFVERLLNRPDGRRTMIVITGDHEALNAFRDKITADPKASFVNRRAMVPFIVVNGGVSGRFESVVGQIDIYPTMLDLLGLDSYPWRGQGCSIFSRAFPHAAVCGDGTIVTDRQEPVDTVVATHLREANVVGPLIIRHDLLNERMRQ